MCNIQHMSMATIMMCNKQHVSVATIITNGSSLLLGKRSPGYGGGSWGLPGGKVDKGEPVYDAAYRELAEETGIDNVVLRWSHYVNTDKYLIMVFEGDIRVFDFGSTQTPQALDGFDQVEWIDPEKLTQLNLFLPTKLVLKQHHAYHWWV